MVPFKPNSAFVLARDDHTIHGVRFESKASDFARITIQSNLWSVHPTETLLPR